jgi:hypothetical protein
LGSANGSGATTRLGAVQNQFLPRAKRNYFEIELNMRRDRLWCGDP